MYVQKLYKVEVYLASNLILGHIYLACRQNLCIFLICAHFLTPRKSSISLRPGRRKHTCATHTAHRQKTVLTRSE